MNAGTQKAFMRFARKATPQLKRHLWRIAFWLVSMEHRRLTGVLSKLINPDASTLPKIVKSLEEDVKFLGEMSAEEYHSGLRRMNSSGVRKILRTPRHFLTWWLGLDKEEEEKDYFRFGRAAHAMLLEPQKFRELYVVEPVHTGFTKDGKPTTSANAESVKAAKALWLAKQRPDALILTEKEMIDLIGMAESVLEHKIASNLLSNGKPEVTVLWTDEETGIACRARPDYLVRDKDNGLHIIDFKTTSDIREGALNNAIRKYGYDTQLAFYHDGVRAVTGEIPVSITIIAVEKEPPYECAVHPLDDKWFAAGQKKYKAALRTYKKCITENKWPAYQASASVLMMPSWMEYDNLPEFNWE